MINAPHVPVLLDEMSEHLLIKKDGIYLDGTKIKIPAIIIKN